MVVYLTDPPILVMFDSFSKSEYAADFTGLMTALSSDGITCPSLCR